jgi:hypothetical protein
MRSRRPPRELGASSPRAILAKDGIDIERWTMFGPRQLAAPSRGRQTESRATNRGSSSDHIQRIAAKGSDRAKKLAMAKGRHYNLSENPVNPLTIVVITHLLGIERRLSPRQANRPSSDSRKTQGSPRRKAASNSFTHPHRRSRPAHRPPVDPPSGYYLPSCRNANVNSRRDARNLLRTTKAPGPTRGCPHLFVKGFRRHF